MKCQHTIPVDGTPAAKADAFQLCLLSAFICALQYPAPFGLRDGRHAVARAICYGQRGEIRKRYREGQEDQLGALGLVTNAVVLWNTLYMQEALSWMRSNGEETGEEDIARLSPLMHGHINMLGHYTFTLSENIMNGELRTLNFNLNNELSP